MFSDLLSTLQWWSVFFVIGSIFLPLTNLVFSNFLDKGYVFSKIIGVAFVSYVVFILGFLKIVPFTQATIFVVIASFAGINILIFRKKIKSTIEQFNSGTIKIIIFEEILFLGVLLFWSFIHAHQPEIHGLEKYMDYGFINSILRAKYFPPLDMWLSPFYINYYYFGHLITAVLTKLSFLPSSTTFNLMLSTIAALSFTSAFSIGANLIKNFIPIRSGSNFKLTMGGLISAFILNFAGNLHAIYLFFKPYANENPIPFWQLLFSPQTFPNAYWYPNATRFIHNTIHEFPIYSYVVSDLHGHVLDIPFVLFTIALLLSIFLKQKRAVLELKNQNSKIKTATQNLKLFSYKLIPLNFELCVLSFILAIMYMTNAWDGIIYFVLSSLIIGYIILVSKIDLHGISKLKSFIILFFPKILLLGVLFFLFTLPFNLNFKPFASGIGVLCAPKFLTDLGKLGPFLFEASHCEHSSPWQLFILYGFFYFWVISFVVFLLRSRKITAPDVFVLILISLSTLLIIIPEFIYVKDIYPAHYRANTMFKLVYQSFMMLSIASGYIIFRISNFKFQMSNVKLSYWIIGLFIVCIVFLYPYLAINSYFGNLKAYYGLDGIKYLNNLYANDYQAILWINKNIKGQPVILEAQGDSYTDFGRVSANTGLPTVLGWTVHEWLWRGTYDIPAPRIDEIKKMYESEDIGETNKLLKRYGVSLVFIGSLERQKYTSLNEEKFKLMGKIIYQSGNTSIFKLPTAL
ncbi:MAG: DUF2298 domain-containing protein [Candidatus Levybacteria bacterium]|nr:DUF2298 domain-containing protein [Candidatus Levybacteria bacterium]